MSCIWKLFTKKSKRLSTGTVNPPDLKVRNPLNLDEIPSTKLELEAMEGAIIDKLVSLHYQIEDSKIMLARAFRHGDGTKGKELLAKKTILAEKKRVFERRLEKVRSKLEEIHALQ